MPLSAFLFNNDGDMIFSSLPVARHKEFFEPYFGTPQGVSFEGAAKMFGLAYDLPRTAEELAETYRVASVRDRPSLIEVRTDREENTHLHRKLLSEISETTR